MRVRVMVPVVAGLMLAAPAAASAMFVHVVAPGESLYSVAAVDGLSVASLAAANGLPLDAQLIAGSRLLIPPQGATVVASPASAASATAMSAGATSAGDGDGDADDVAEGTAAAPVSTVRAYVVQPGDTLTAIAARAGLTVSSLAAANGLDPQRFLITGTVLRLTGSAPTFVSTSTTTTSEQPVGAAAQGNPTAPPYPTPERVTASQVGQIAAAHGVSPSLAAAVAWQESGFNNALVSSADARGVMQILPGTWDWIQHALVPGAAPLAPASASDNVRGGVYLLRWLLNSTGGDPALAAAGYYQGLPSVRQHGMYRSTQQYVGDILALRRRFGGP